MQQPIRLFPRLRFGGLGTWPQPPSFSTAAPNTLLAASHHRQPPPPRCSRAAPAEGPTAAERLLQELGPTRISALAAWLDQLTYLRFCISTFAKVPRALLLRCWIESSSLTQFQARLDPLHRYSARGTYVTPSARVLLDLGRRAIDDRIAVATAGLGDELQASLHEAWLDGILPLLRLAVHAPETPGIPPLPVLINPSRAQVLERIVASFSDGRPALTSEMLAAAWRDAARTFQRSVPRLRAGSQYRRPKTADTSRAASVLASSLILPSTHTHPALPLPPAVHDALRRHPESLSAGTGADAVPEGKQPRGKGRGGGGPEDSTAQVFPEDPLSGFATAMVSESVAQLLLRPRFQRCADPAPGDWESPEWLAAPAHAAGSWLAWAGFVPADAHSPPGLPAVARQTTRKRASPKGGRGPGGSGVNPWASVEAPAGLLLVASDWAPAGEAQNHPRLQQAVRPHPLVPVFRLPAAARELGGLLGLGKGAGESDPETPAVEAVFLPPAHPAVPQLYALLSRSVIASGQAW